MSTENQNSPPPSNLISKNNFKKQEQNPPLPPSHLPVPSLNLFSNGNEPTHLTNQVKFSYLFHSPLSPYASFSFPSFSLSLKGKEE
jgi:hypothetical protein